MLFLLWILGVVFVFWTAYRIGMNGKLRNFGVGIVSILLILATSFFAVLSFKARFVLETFIEALEWIIFAAGSVRSFFCSAFYLGTRLG